jgi:D-alanine--D-alanine ligase
MNRIRVGVLRGGPSSEYEISLKTGSAVISNLSPEKYNIRDIFIDQDGQWHIEGKPVKISDALAIVDVVFNALHGEYGEDGKVQHIFESHGIPFTGSGSFASAIGMNKEMSKEIYRRNKIKTPQSKLINKKDNLNNKIKEIFISFPLPVVVKPISTGSSVGISIVKSFNNFESAINDAFKYGDIVMVEEFIQGKEATCGVINNFRDKKIYTLPIIEIKPHNGSFFDFEAKYKGKSDEIVPGNFTYTEKKEIEKMAIKAHESLGLSHYSRSDFIIHPKRGIFILETNTLPGLTEESLIPKGLKAVGSSLPHFLDHLIELAMRKK